MAKVKTEYAKGILSGIDMVQECFVKFVGDDPNKMDRTMKIADIIVFITLYRNAVEEDLEKAEAETEAKSNGE